MPLPTAYTQALAHMTLEQRMEVVAIELENLSQIAVGDQAVSAFMWDVAMEEFERARRRANGDLEPRDGE